MALKQCPDCGTRVSSEAKACLRCGRPIRRGVSPARLIVTTIVLLVLIYALLVNIGLLVTNSR